MAADADLGHGHRQCTTSPATACPEVFLTSQGDNKLQTLADGSAQPHVPRHRAQAGVTAPRPYAGGDVLPSTRLARRVPGCEQRRLRRPLRHQRQRRGRCRTSPRRTRATCCSASADGTFAERWRGGRHRVASTAAVVRPWSTSTLTALLDLVEVNRRADVSAVPQRRAGRRQQPAPMGDWVGRSAEQAGAQPRRDRRLGRGPDRRPDDRARGDGRRRPRSGELGWIHFGSGRRRRGRDPQFTGRTVEMGPWLTLPEDRVRDDRARAPAPPICGRRRADGGR